jgi:hypothetical protein
VKSLRTRGLAAATCLAVTAGLFALAPFEGKTSSHREAPLVSADPQIDTTDVWAFVSEDRPDTVSIVASWLPFEEPAGGPNFYSWAEGAKYDINIDNDHDARPDLVYEWVFTNHTRNPNTFLYNTGPVTSLSDPDLNVYQTYDLTLIDKETGRKRVLVEDAISAPTNVGEASMPNYNADLFDAAVRRFGQSYTWAGQSDDAFFLDLRVFDLLYGANLSEVGDDTLAGFNVQTLALQVPKDDLAMAGDAEANPIIGIWSTTSRPSVRIQGANGSSSSHGKFVQVSRLGMPLVNEVVIPAGLKDYFNSSKPTQDPAALPLVQDPELPHLLRHPGLGPGHGRHPAGRPGQRLPDRRRRAQPARRGHAQRDAAAQHVDRAVLGRVLDPRRPRRRPRRVPERPATVGRHHRRLAPGRARRAAPRAPADRRDDR